jgi:alpha-L-fucosidase
LRFAGLIKYNPAMKNTSILSVCVAVIVIWVGFGASGLAAQTPASTTTGPAEPKKSEVIGEKTSISQGPACSNQRAGELKKLRFGMFICWSFSTFSGTEWTRGVTDPAFFKATGCDVDQWAKTAKEAGMGYILFLTKHHDGFCLWDTATTKLKVTNSPLKKDVLAELRSACNKYGIKLAMYFSEGDWTWIKDPLPADGLVPGSPSYDNPIWRSSKNPELKKAQLKELCTKYGPIEFFWMDHAIGDGGLSHAETEAWIHQFQPGCFVGFNHGEAAGQLCLREMGRAGAIGDEEASEYNKKAEKSYKGYLVAEFTYPIQPKCPNGAEWFYSQPENENVCHPAEKIYQDYLGAVKYGNIFSLDVGPRPDGRLRDIDVATLQKIGRYLRGEITVK